MPSFQEYICNQIEAKLRDRKIVVIYDEREDFLPLFDRDLHNPAIDNSNIHKILDPDRLNHQQKTFCRRLNQTKSLVIFR